jgi:transcription elongation factor GreA
MQTPQRKLGKYAHLKPDPHLTEAKYLDLKYKLERLKKHSQPKAIDEVKRLAEMGDFSENAAYQIAKGRLRGINQGIIDIENHLKRAIIIKTSANKETVQLGHFVTVLINGKEKTYQLLGSSETNPSLGVISHNSPLGSALLGSRLGEIIKVKMLNGIKDYKIIKIE